MSPTIVPPRPGPPPTGLLPPTPTERAAGLAVGCALPTSPLAGAATARAASYNHNVPATSPAPCPSPASSPAPSTRSVATGTPTVTTATTSSSLLEEEDDDDHYGDLKPVTRDANRPTTTQSTLSTAQPTPARSTQRRFRTGIGGSGNVARPATAARDDDAAHSGGDDHDDAASSLRRHSQLGAPAGRAVLVPMALVGAPRAAPQRRCGIGGAGNVVRVKKEKGPGVARDGEPQTLWTRLVARSRPWEG